MRNSEFIRIVHKGDHDELAADTLFSRRLYNCRWVKGGRVGVDGKDRIAFREPINGSQHNNLLIRQIEDCKKFTMNGE